MSWMSVSGNGESGGIRSVPSACIRWIISERSTSFGVTNLRVISVSLPINRADRSTDARWASAEWQFAVAHDGWMIADDMNDQVAGRSSSPPHPAPVPNANANERTTKTIRLPSHLGSVFTEHIAEHH